MEKLLNKQMLSIQNPITYIGNELNSVTKQPDKVSIRFAFCFPDVYEIGMSHLGLRIIYDLINKREDSYCERVFAPDVNMEKIMRENNIKLYGLESKDSIDKFDMIGFTLQYELSYTNILNMLDLAKVEILSKNRKEGDPFVCAGGPCAYNPETLAEYVDFFMMGEGEEIIPEVLDVYNEWKKSGKARFEFLKAIAKIEGIYVPQLYAVDYADNNTIKSFSRIDGENTLVAKRIIKDMDKVDYPTCPIVPYSSIVHDRVMMEVFRGCIRGCRFCQAGYVYRPVREKSVDRVVELAKANVENSGYEEISLTSLSTSDYLNFNDLANKLIDEFKDKKVNISLPSLRIDSINPELLEKIKEVRKSGLTFAPEAGTQRLRDVINKNITEDEILNTCDMVFRNGWNVVKLYFMIGLPTETFEDLDGIIDMANKVIEKYYSIPKGERTKGLKVTISISPFVPKPFTPFQWCSQDSMELIKEKIAYLSPKLKRSEISFNWHDPKTSFLEGVISRGDRRIGQVIYEAWKNGCKFDSWGEHFKYDVWMKSFEALNIDPLFYNARERELTEILPWDFIDIGVNKSFFISERALALGEKTTRNCREQCSNCGAAKFGGGVCFE